MKNFEIIDEREGHIRDRGYSLVHGAEMHYDHDLADKLSNDYGENMVDNLIDSFYDGWNTICKGDDGKLYAVDFRYAYDEFTPFIWQEAKAA